MIGLDIVKVGQIQKAYRRTTYYGLDPDRLRLTLQYASAKNTRQGKPKILQEFGTADLLNEEQEKVFLGPQMFEL